MNFRPPPPHFTIPVNPGRDDLLYWIRSIAPDHRIRKARTEDGRRGCLATFTFRGEEIKVEAIEDENTDPDDAIVRRSAAVLYQRLGIRTHVDEARTSQLEADVVKARLDGNAEQADRLALELALSNEGYSRPRKIRARWER